MRKLVILSREAGYRVEMEDVKARLFIPDELFACSMEEFWKRLPELDTAFESRRQVLEKEHKRLRFVARMDSGRCSVGLEEVDSTHSFYASRAPTTSYASPPNATTATRCSSRATEPGLMSQQRECSPT